jgi:predicted enzyme related to lactoylglutathione lyase
MKLTTHLAVIPVMVTDQEEALAFYTEKLGLEKRTDMVLAPGLRFLTVATKGQKKPEIALAKPDESRQNASQPMVLPARRDRASAWIFMTDDCCKAYETLLARGVKFVTAPVKQFYGTEAIFEDPYGNVFMLLEASPKARSLFRNRCVGKAA